MLSRHRFKMRLMVFVFCLGNPVGLSLVSAADWSISSEIRSASIFAGANQSFGGGPGNVMEEILTVPALFPEKLETGVRDSAGKEREASGIIRLEMNEGAVRIVGKISAKDSKPNDFIAPITTIKGRVKINLLVVLPEEGASLSGKIRLSGEGVPDLIGEAGKKMPTNIVVQVWVNERPLLKSSDFLLGIEKKIPRSLRHGDNVTILFQGDFSLFSKGEADIVSTLSYSFEPQFIKPD